VSLVEVRWTVLVSAYYLPGGPALPDQADTLVEVEGDAASGAPRSWFHQLVLGTNKECYLLVYLK
jgi:hypothetical protein